MLLDAQRPELQVMEFDPLVHVTKYGAWFLLTDGGRNLPPLAGGASFSDEYEKKILEHITGKVELVKNAKTFLALCTVVPTDASTGTTITEATYTGYARKEILAAEFEAATGTSPTAIKNSGVLTFAACTAGTSTVIGFALCDALTVGNIVMWGTVASTVISTTQTPATVAAKALELTLD